MVVSTIVLGRYYLPQSARQQRVNSDSEMLATKGLLRDFTTPAGCMALGSKPGRFLEPCGTTLTFFPALQMPLENMDATCECAIE